MLLRWESLGPPMSQRWINTGPTRPKTGMRSQVRSSFERFAVSRHSHFVTTRDIGYPLFNHLVSSNLQCERNCEPQSFCCPRKGRCAGRPDNPFGEG